MDSYLTPSTLVATLPSAFGGRDLLQTSEPLTGELLGCQLLLMKKTKWWIY
jgi:hypothetical protein